MVFCGLGPDPTQTDVNLTTLERVLYVILPQRGIKYSLKTDDSG